MSLFSFAEGEDYSFDSVPPVINIQSGMSRGCLTINIIASALAEDIEGIYLAINETTTMADVEEGSTIVVINADGGVCIKYLSTVYPRSLVLLFMMFIHFTISSSFQLSHLVLAVMNINSWREMQ